MFKTKKPLVAGSLAIGLFLGLSSLINPSIASAATANNHQAITGSGQFAGSEGSNAQQPGNIAPVRHNLSSQAIQKQKLSFNSIITRAAQLIGVSKEVVLDGVKSGSSLVDIARSNGVNNASILTRLRSLQKALDMSIEPGQVNDVNNKPSIKLQPNGVKMIIN